MAAPHVVTTGLDPVVHAELGKRNRAAIPGMCHLRMDCRVKPGNDGIEIPFSRRLRTRVQPVIARSNATKQSRPEPQNLMSKPDLTEPPDWIASLHSQ
jgi:hypothetical protein